MSAKSTSSKSKSTSKPTAKAAEKPAAKAKPAAKSRLAGPKPPKVRAATVAARTVSKPATEPAASSPPKAAPARGRIPAPPAAATAATANPAELKKRELIELVVARSDVKKKFAKPVIEAMLEVMGETVAEGREMNLPSLGKVKYNRTKETPAARVVITKIRQSKTAGAGPAEAKETVADAAE